jgi:hypothetical protein
MMQDSEWEPLGINRKQGFFEVRIQGFYRRPELIFPQMTTRSNAPASLKRWDKSG